MLRVLPFRLGLITTALTLVACGGDDGPGAVDDGTDSSGSTTGEPGSTDASDVGETEIADDTGSGSTTTGMSDTGTDTDSDTDTGGPTADCSLLAEGTVTDFVVDGMPREFILNLPEGVEDGGPWPVVFNWHGLGDTAQNMSGLVAPYVDDPTMPFIAVTPEDTDYVLDLPLPGLPPLDWEVFAVDPNDNRELALFDEVLECLDVRYGVDPDHVHSMGFSLGGIVTDMLASNRSDVLASVATYSGGYWNNPDNVTGLLANFVTWPEYDADPGYPQLILHGDTTDIFDLVLLQIHFDEYAEADSTFLNDRGHDTVVCNHGGGHTAPPPDMTPDRLVEFFADHPFGTSDSPYSGGLPASFAEYCEFRGQTP